MGFYRNEPNTAVMTLKQISTQAGMPLPEDLAKEIEATDPGTQDQFLHVDRDALHARLVDHLEEGTDPLKDPDVLLDAVRLSLQAVNPGAVRQSWMLQRRQAALFDAVPRILDVWSEVVEKAGETMKRGLADLPGVDVLRDQPALHPGGRGVVAWAEVQSALFLLEMIAQGYSVILDIAKGSAVPKDRMPLAFADLTLAEYESLPEYTARGVAAAGHTLSLAAPDEFRHRCDQLDAARAERRAAASRSREQNMRL